MPETPVDEYRHAGLREDDVCPAARQARDRAVDAETEAATVELLSQRDLRCGVASGLSGHARGDLRRRRRALRGHGPIVVPSRYVEVVVALALPRRGSGRLRWGTVSTEQIAPAPATSPVASAVPIRVLD